jgi:tRNA pseudouridine55 synthase
VRQRPPAHSAVKIGGRRAYALARAGVAVETSEREVTVHRFEELWRERGRRGYLIECSSGTYVRSLIADLGDAYCEALRRTRIGPFDVAGADPERVVGLAEALAHLEAIRIPDDAAERLLHGASVELGVSGDAPVRVLDGRGLVALAEPDGAGALHVTLRLRDPAE